jgi:hypothetical protein
MELSPPYGTKRVAGGDGSQCQRVAVSTRIDGGVRAGLLGGHHRQLHTRCERQCFHHCTVRAKRATKSRSVRSTFQNYSTGLLLRFFLSLIKFITFSCYRAKWQTSNIVYGLAKLGVRINEQMPPRVLKTIFESINFAMDDMKEQEISNTIYS